VVLNSRVLSVLASKVAADPFKKVKKMINDLLIRLQEEANAEAEHKAWCDTELKNNEQTRNEKSDRVEALTAEIEGLESSIATLTKEINTLSEEIAELERIMAKATELRAAEKKENEATIADAKAAQKAVAAAMTILAEFYEKANDATALVQQQPEAPATFDKPYKGMQSENGGVMGFLEVIESDFARLESDTTADENNAQKAYDEETTKNTANKSSKTTARKHKTKKKKDAESDLESAKKDRVGTQKELDLAEAYFEKLKPTCVDASVSHEDRAGKREQEIQSLQEALKILSDM